MTTPASAMQSVGLAINAYRPLAVTGGIAQDARTYQREVTSYRHTIQAFGGYESAEFQIAGSIAELERWLDYPIGGHIEVSDQAGQVWEGFVNQITMNPGTLSLATGPLLDLANRVGVTYTETDYTTVPPTSLGQTLTALADDTASQAIHGIWEKWIDGGKSSAADAELRRDVYLSRRAWPTRKETINIQPSGQPFVTVSCLGYHYWLQAYIYAQLTASTMVSISDYLKAILAADPNHVISASTTRIQENAYLVPSYEGDTAYAEQLIKDVLQIGDASANRWTFGLYDGRQVQYEQTPVLAEYHQEVYSSDTALRTIGNARVWPWRVRPCKWLQRTDFAAGRVPVDTPINQDVRATFIESVDYTAPWGLQINGGKLDIYAQIAKQIDGGGINP